MNHSDQLLELASQLPAFQPLSIVPIAAAGSNRSYFRITAASGKTLIGTASNDLRENQAFFYLSRFFKQFNCPVPTIISIHESHMFYLQQDLGDLSLYQLAKENGFSETVVQLFKQSLSELLKMHLKAGSQFDYQICYPRAEMDYQSFVWDLNYFKYYFLKPLGILFDEQKLEDEFIRLALKLDAFPRSGFLFRDFQARNIMIHQNKAYFIDYQGGRKGTPTYDLASLLYQSSLEMPENLQTELRNFYFLEIEKTLRIPLAQSEYEFRYFLLIRLMQVLGAYGFRGLIENKEYFKKSIPGGLKNLLNCLNEFPEKQLYPELCRALYDCTALPAYQDQAKGKTSSDPSPIPATINETKAEKNTELLTVRISSFSFRKSIPEDPSGHGGGFVFDCRALPNPGREPEFKFKSGKDQEVIDYLDNKSEVQRFLDQAELLIQQSIDSYLKRNFKHLMISFGCTGGQHRSVYCAEYIFRKLSENKKINPILTHWEEGVGWGK